MKATFTETKPQQSVTKVGQSAMKAETKTDGNTPIRLYFCSMCTATFWTDGGLRHHESLHFKKSAFDPDHHTQELEKKCQETEEPNEKDSKDIRNLEKKEESEEEEKQKGDE